MEWNSGIAYTHLPNSPFFDFKVTLKGFFSDMVVGAACDVITGKLLKVIRSVLKDYRFSMFEIAIE